MTYIQISYLTKPTDLLNLESSPGLGVRPLA